MAAGEIEVTRLVARLVGDGTQFDRMTKTAARQGEALKRKLGTVKTASEKVTKSVKQLGSEVLETAKRQTNWDRNTRIASITLGKFDRRVMGVVKSLGQMGVAAKVGLGALAAGSGATLLSGLQRAGQYEQTQIAFETIVGNAREANALLDELTEFAAETPFQLTSLQQTAQQMITFGEESENVMPAVKMIGDLAAGSSSDIGMLGMVFNQVRGVSKLLTQDFRQLSSRGVLSLQDLADHFDVTTAKAQEMMSAGQISFDDFRNILEGLTGEGGRFFNAMEKQSQSLIGKWSTLTDNVAFLRWELGVAFMPVAKEFVGWGIEILKFFRGMPSPVKAAATALVAFTAAASAAATAMMFLGGEGGVRAINTFKSIMVWAGRATKKVLASSAGLMAIGGALALYAVYSTMMSKYNERVQEATIANQGFTNALKLQYKEMDAAREEMSGTMQFLEVKDEMDSVGQKMDIVKDKIEQQTARYKEAKAEADKWLNTFNPDAKGSLKEQAQYLENAQNEMKVYKDRLEELSEQHEKLAAAQERGSKATIEQTEAARKHVIQLRDQLRFERQKARGGEQDRTVFDMMVQGVEPRMIQDARRFQAELDKIAEKQEKHAQAKAKAEQEAEKLQAARGRKESKAQSLIESTLSSQEKVKRNIAEINGLRTMGLLTEEQARRARVQAVSDLKTATPSQARTPQFAQSLNRLSSQFTADRQGARRSAQDERRDAYIGLGATRQQAVNLVGRESRTEGKTDADRIVGVLERIETLLEEGRTGEAVGLINELPEEA